MRERENFVRVFGFQENLERIVLEGNTWVSSLGLILCNRVRVLVVWKESCEGCNFFSNSGIELAVGELNGDIGQAILSEPR